MSQSAWNMSKQYLGKDSGGGGGDMEGVQIEYAGGTWSALEKSSK